MVQNYSSFAQHDICCLCSFGSPRKSSKCQVSPIQQHVSLAHRVRGSKDVLSSFVCVQDSLVMIGLNP